MGIKNIGLTIFISSILIGSIAVNADAIVSRDRIEKYSTNYKELKGNIVTKDKVWTIKFTQEVKASSINGDSIKVIDSEGKEVAVTVKILSDTKQAQILPPTGGYSEGDYSVIITNKVLSNTDSSKLFEEVVMQFTVGTSTTTEKVSMEQLLKDYRGGMTYNSITKNSTVSDFVAAYNSDKTGYFSKLKSYLETPLYKDMSTNWRDWYFNLPTMDTEYTKIRNEFNKKYLNETYADVTDMNYFTKLAPNLNWDKVNIVTKIGENNFGLGAKVFRFGDVTNVDINKDIRLQFIWREDLQKELLTKINDFRRLNGLASLSLNKDLTAISMYSLKQTSIFNLFSSSNTYGAFENLLDTTSNEYSDNVIRKLGNRMGVTYTTDALTPTMYTKFDKLSGLNSLIPMVNMGYDFSYYNNYNSANLVNSTITGKKLFENLDTVASRLGYNKTALIPIYGTGNFNRAEDFIKGMKDDFSQNTLFKTASLLVGKDYTNGFTKKPMGEFLNAKHKNIGIAVSYSIPKTPVEMQGVSNVYIILSE